MLMDDPPFSVALAGADGHFRAVFFRLNTLSVHCMCVKAALNMLEKMCWADIPMMLHFRPLTTDEEQQTSGSCLAQW